jgi:hypothetical protein
MPHYVAPMLRAALLAMIIALPALADEPPAQWQYEESLEVPPGPLPRDRCLRARYTTQELRDERGYRFEWWSAPISDATAHWLSWHRDRGSLTLTFCDRGGDA